MLSLFSEVRTIASSSRLEECDESQFQACPSLPASGICHFVLEKLQMPHVGAGRFVQQLHRGVQNSVQMPHSPQGRQHQNFIFQGKLHMSYLRPAQGSYLFLSWNCQRTRFVWKFTTSQFPSLSTLSSNVKWWSKFSIREFFCAKKVKIYDSFGTHFKKKWW